MALVKCIDLRNEAALRQFALPAELLPRRAPTDGYRFPSTQHSPDRALSTDRPSAGADRTWRRDTVPAE